MVRHQSYEQIAHRSFQWAAVASVIVFLAAAAALGTLHRPWYIAEFEGGVVDGTAVAPTQVSVQSDALPQLAPRSPIRARLNRTSAEATVATTGSIPRFVVFAVVALLLAAAGLTLRMVPLVGVAFVAEILAVNYAASVRSALEDSVRRYSSGWVLHAASGTTLFWAAVTAALLTTVAGGAFLFRAHRADRSARMERGEEVEETLFERIERLLTRSPIRRMQP